jgi:hypothetical protein
MPRIRLNADCNILTGADTKNPRSTPEITVPALRINLQPEEAERLANNLLQAVRFTKKYRPEPV